MFFQDLKDIPEVINVLGFYLTFYHHIVYVNLDVVSQLRLEHPGHHPLVGNLYVFQTKGHHFVMVIFNRNDKSCHLLIIQS